MRAILVICIIALVILLMITTMSVLIIWYTSSAGVRAHYIRLLKIACVGMFLGILTCILNAITQKVSIIIIPLVVFAYIVYRCFKDCFEEYQVIKMRIKAVEKREKEVWNKVFK